MRRIAIDLRMYRHSGIGRYLRNLMPVLVPLLEADAVRVIATSGLISGEEWPGDRRVEHVQVRAGVYSLGEQALAFRGVYGKTALLWVPHYNVPVGYRGRLAVTIHDLAPIALAETFSSRVKREYARFLIRRAAASATAILTVSRFTANELEARLGVDARKITVTYPGIDRLWPKSAAAHREEDGVPYFLYVGNVKPNKNLKLLLGAFGRVLDRVPHRLVLAGRIQGFGTEDRAVLRQAEGLGDRVRWAGEVSDEELMALYAGADAFVMPSLYEGFGLPLLEAMHMECPVLCSDAGSLREVGGEAALYFDPRNEDQLVGRLLQVMDRSMMDALRDRGRERVREFSYGRCAEQTAAVLNETMKEER